MRKLPVIRINLEDLIDYLIYYINIHTGNNSEDLIHHWFEILGRPLTGEEIYKYCSVLSKDKDLYKEEDIDYYRKLLTSLNKKHSKMIHSANVAAKGLYDLGVGKKLRKGKPHLAPGYKRPVSSLLIKEKKNKS